MSGARITAVAGCRRYHPRPGFAGGDVVVEAQIRLLREESAFNGHRVWFAVEDGPAMGGILRIDAGAERLNCSATDTTEVGVDKLSNIDDRMSTTDE